MATQKEIMQDMLDQVSSSTDKREGAVIYDTLAPTAYGLAKNQEYVDKNYKNTFAGTADRDGLIERCKEIGISPMPATYAIRKGVFTPATLEIAIGERFSFEDLNFTVTEKLETPGEYALTCETIGTAGNYGEGQLIPIQYVNGLETATLTGEVMIYGEEEEDTETLRQRYFDTLPTMTIDGNVAQYQKWCREYSGIGNYKIFPEWNGKNTVKVSILTSENTVANRALLEDFQEFLDPPTSTINDNLEASDYPQGRGLGMGKAPIGAIVTVSTASEKTINIEATVILRTGYESVVGLNEQLTEYLKSLNYVRTTVSYIAISAVFANNNSIDLVLDVTVNGAKDNIELTEEEVAKLGEVTVEISE